MNDDRGAAKFGEIDAGAVELAERERRHRLGGPWAEFISLAGYAGGQQRDSGQQNSPEQLRPATRSMSAPKLGSLDGSRAASCGQGSGNVNFDF